LKNKVQEEKENKSMVDLWFLSPKSFSVSCNYNIISYAKNLAPPLTPSTLPPSNVNYFSITTIICSFTNHSIFLLKELSNSTKYAIGILN
jgi:hypothetical protein